MNMSAEFCVRVMELAHRMVFAFRLEYQGDFGDVDKYQSTVHQ